MNKKIFSIIALVSCIASAFSLFPHLYAYTNVPEGTVFTGQAAWFDPWDISVYVAAVKSGQLHGFLMENMYTTEVNQAIVYYPLYTLAGMTFPTTNPFIVFYGFSIVTTGLLVTALTLIARQFFDDHRVVFLMVLSIIIASGLGIIFFPEIQSLDTYMTSITFHSAIQRPHEGLAMAAYVLALFGFYFVTQNKTSWRKITLGALIILLILYPYNILSYFLILAAFSLWQYQKKAHSVVGTRFGWTVLLTGVCVVGLMAYNLSLNSTFAGVVRQKLLGPTFVPFILTYGLLLIPFFYQLIQLRPLSPLQRFLSSWIVVSVVLSLLPLGIARFFLRSMFVPLVLLAVLSLQAVCKRYLPKQFPGIFVVFLIYLLGILSMTSIGIFYLRLQEVEKKNPWYYMATDEAAALSYLRDHGQTGEGVLSLLYIGNQIPIHTNLRVYFGHLLQTPDGNRKLEKLTKFYEHEMDEWTAKEFLIEANVSYVYYGIDESSLSSTFEYSFLEPVFSQGVVKIYRVK